jgi:ADP-ribose pyrophosphatase YjhB (NUDIX family)
MGAAQHRDNAAATAGASVVVLTRDGVLMVERARAPFEGVWSFPGGRSERGEEAEATARRELLEETGLDVGRLIRLGTFKPAPDRTPLTLTVFAARAGEGAPQPGDDALKAEFVPLSAVLERRTTPGAAGWIARALAALADPPLP